MIYNLLVQNRLEGDEVILETNPVESRKYISGSKIIIIEEKSISNFTIRKFRLNFDLILNHKIS